MKIGFGEVVEVKKLRSMQVCRVSVELPIEAYKEAVALLDSERVLIVPSDLQQGFGILVSNESENAFSGRVAPEQIAELPQYENGKANDHVDEDGIFGSSLEQWGSDLETKNTFEGLGIVFDEIDVPESDIVTHETVGGEVTHVDLKSGEVVTGGKLAQHLDRIGAWRNPAIWRFFCNSDVSLMQYRKWIAEKPCVVTGYKSEGEPNAPHHWRELATGAGTSLKPEDRWCVPLCDNQHKMLHNYGSDSWCETVGLTNEEMKAMAVSFMAEFNRMKFKEHFDIDSMREITPDHVVGFYHESGVKL